MIVWYVVDLSYANYLIGVKNDRMVKVPPIARWAHMEKFDKFSNYVKGKGGTIKELGEQEIGGIGGEIVYE